MTQTRANASVSPTVKGMDDITLVYGECGGNGCKKCGNSGTVTIVE